MHHNSLRKTKSRQKNPQSVRIIPKRSISKARKVQSSPNRKPLQYATILPESTGQCHEAEVWYEPEKPKHEHRPPHGKVPMTTPFKSRYTGQATPKSHPFADVRYGMLSNGIKISTINSTSPIHHMSISINMGCQFESSNDPAGLTSFFALVLQNILQDPQHSIHAAKEHNALWNTEPSIGSNNNTMSKNGHNYNNTIAAGGNGNVKPNWRDQWQELLRPVQYNTKDPHVIMKSPVPGDDVVKDVQHGSIGGKFTKSKKNHHRSTETIPKRGIDQAQTLFEQEQQLYTNDKLSEYLSQRKKTVADILAQEKKQQNNNDNNQSNQYLNDGIYSFISLLPTQQIISPSIPTPITDSLSSSLTTIDAFAPSPLASTTVTAYKEHIMITIPLSTHRGAFQYNLETITRIIGKMLQFPMFSVADIENAKLQLETSYYYRHFNHGDRDDDEFQDGHPSRHPSHPSDDSTSTIDPSLLDMLIDDIQDDCIYKSSLHVQNALRLSRYPKKKYLSKISTSHLSRWQKMCIISEHISISFDGISTEQQYQHIMDVCQRSFGFIRTGPFFKDIMAQYHTLNPNIALQSSLAIQSSAQTLRLPPHVANKNDSATAATAAAKTAPGGPTTFIQFNNTDLQQRFQAHVNVFSPREWHSIPNDPVLAGRYLDAGLSAAVMTWQSPSIRTLTQFISKYNNNNDSGDKNHNKNKNNDELQNPLESNPESPSTSSSSSMLSSLPQSSQILPPLLWNDAKSASKRAKYHTTALSPNLDLTALDAYVLANVLGSSNVAYPSPEFDGNMSLSGVGTKHFELISTHAGLSQPQLTTTTTTAFNDMGLFSIELYYDTPGVNLLQQTATLARWLDPATIGGISSHITEEQLIMATNQTQLALSRSCERSSIHLTQQLARQTQIFGQFITPILQQELTQNERYQQPDVMIKNLQGIIQPQVKSTTHDTQQESSSTIIKTNSNHNDISYALSTVGYIPPNILEQ